MKFILIGWAMWICWVKSPAAALMKLPHADVAQAFGTELLCVGLAKLI